MTITDVVIIGAGPAGRTRSVDAAGERVNTGAMFVYTDTESHRVRDELGIETFPVEPDTFGVRNTVLGGSTAEPEDLSARYARSVGSWHGHCRTACSRRQPGSRRH